MELERKRRTNLVESWCKDRHEEPIVDITNQLVSDIRVGHLGTVHFKKVCVSNLQSSRKLQPFTMC